MSDLTNNRNPTGDIGRAGTGGMRAGGHHLTCLFGSRAAAERALSALESEGIPRSRIDMVDGAQAGAAATAGETGEGGFWDSLKRFFTGDDAYHGYQEGVRRGHTLVRVRTANESEADRATDVLERFEPIDMDEQEASWRQEGWTAGDLRGDDLAIGAAAGMAQPAVIAADTGIAAGGSPVAGGTSPTGGSEAAGSATLVAGGAARAAGIAQSGTYAGAASPAGSTSPGAAAHPDATPQRLGVATEGEQIIPVMQETLRVGKRDTARGSVRVRAYTVETPVTEEVRLRTERVAVERRPVDRAAAPGDGTFRDRTVEMTERDEEAVVAKDARVVEEVVVRKDVGERTETIRDTTRRTEVEVEDGTRLAASTGPTGGASGPGGPGTPTARRDGAADDDRPRDTLQGDVRPSLHGSRGAAEADPASLPPTGEYKKPSGEGRGGR